MKILLLYYTIIIIFLNYNYYYYQHCTLKKFKNLDGPIKKNKKTQGQISMQLAEISGKNPTFPIFYPPKFLMTWVFLESSTWNFQIFIRQKVLIATSSNSL